jgi:hypothetical protein
MDGKPLPNVHVSFQPIASKATDNPGPGSVGATDAQGRYALKISAQTMEGEGAVVGKHRVFISTIFDGGNDNFNPETGTPDGAPVKLRERIPARYNTQSKMEFDVPTGGTEKADFKLTSK